MHNWWIAALEHLGLITQEEAVNISNEIKLGIHRENYDDAFKELDAILQDNKIVIEDRIKHAGDYVSNFSKLEARVKALEDQAVTEVKKTVASKTKA